MPHEAHREAVLNDPAAHLQEAQSLHRQGRLTEALAHCEAAARLRPGDHRLRFDLGNLLREMGRPEEALAAYDRAVALAPAMRPPITAAQASCSTSAGPRRP